MSKITSPEIITKIAIWRQKAADGTLTIEDCKEYVIVLRGGRRSAAEASEASRKTKARKVVKSAEEMLNELGSL